MVKRVRVPEAKAGELMARWGRPEQWDAPDLCFAGGTGTDRSDRRILAEALEGAAVHDGRNLRQELAARGYDISTLRFSIQKKS